MGHSPSDGEPLTALHEWTMLCAQEQTQFKSMRAIGGKPPTRLKLFNVPISKPAKEATILNVNIRWNELKGIKDFFEETVKS